MARDRYVLVLQRTVDLLAGRQSDLETLFDNLCAKKHDALCSSVRSRIDGIREAETLLREVIAQTIS